MRRDLLALGSAAVLAVYSAGYQRTKEAAERFANETAQRRRPPRPVAEEAASGGTAGSNSTATAANKATAAASKAATNLSGTVSAKKLPSSKAASRPAETVIAKKSTDTASVQSTPSASATQPVELAPAAPAPAAPAPTPMTIAPPVDSTASQSASADTAHAKAAAKWKDGVYAAWGTSRHGDLEASVQIMNGKIVAAWISQCWTRYPCSRIAALPPQVVQRQSENVDTISGVTQSADAFYYAVMEALIKAKP